MLFNISSMVQKDTNGQRATSWNACVSKETVSRTNPTKSFKRPTSPRSTELTVTQTPVERRFTSSELTPMHRTPIPAALPSDVHSFEAPSSHPSSHLRPNVKPRRTNMNRPYPRSDLPPSPTSHPQNRSPRQPSKLTTPERPISHRKNLRHICWSCGPTFGRNET